MQIHPSTKRLIDRLYDMTLERKIAWKQGADGAVVYDTERYRVSLVGTPTEVVLSSDTGAELDKADHQELTNTLLEDGTTYAEYVGQLHKEAHRIARGAESAIEEVLSTLIDTDGDGVLDSPAPAENERSVPAPPVEMPESSDEVEEAVSEPAIEELSSERVADAVASMAKDVNGDETGSDTIEASVEPNPEPEGMHPEPSPPPEAPSVPTPPIRGSGIGIGGLGGQSGFSNPLSQTPPPQRPVATEPEADKPAAAVPQAPNLAVPPPIPRQSQDAQPAEEKASPEAEDEPNPPPADKPAPIPPPLTGGYTPSPFGIMAQRGPSQPPAQPVPAVPPVPATPPPIKDDAATTASTPETDGKPAEPAPQMPPPIPNPQAQNSTLGGSALGVPPIKTPEAPTPPIVPPAPEMPEMGSGVEESKIANLVGSITETVDDDPPPEETLSTVPPAVPQTPAIVSDIAEAASPAIKRTAETVAQAGEDAAGSLKQRSIGIIDETGDVIRGSVEDEASQSPTDTDDSEPPKPPSKRFNPWR